MSDKRKIMVCICPNVSSEIGDPLEEKLRDEFSISFVSLQQVQDIFPLLSNPTFQCDYISIDLEQLYCTENVDVFAMLNTLTTLLNCTSVRLEDGTLARRNASIVILVGTKTTAEFIKEIISLPAVSYIGLRTGDGHAVLIVGYDLATQTFTVENSFGTDWGLNGYFTMSFDYAEDWVFETWVYDLPQLA